MHSPHYHHAYSAHRFESEFSQVFAYRSVRALGISLMAVFMPIYLFEQSEDVFLSLLLITGYFSAVYFVRMLTTVYAANLVARIGGKHVLRISTVLDVIFLILLANISVHPLLIVLAGLIQGLSSSFFFVALHIELSHSIGKNTTHGVGTVEIVRKITMAIGPLIGGIIAGLFGFEYLVYIAAGVLVLGLFPLQLQSEPLRSTKAVKPNYVRGLLLHDKGCKANFGMALNTAAVAFSWPLFIYIYLESYQSVGVVVSLSLVVALLIMMVVRKGESNRAVSKEIIVGGRGSSLTHLLRSLAVNPLLITIVNVFNDIFLAIFHVPYIAQYYKNASNEDRAAYISAMEISYSSGIIFFMMILMASYQITSSIRLTLTAGFLAGAIGVLANKEILRATSQ